MKLLSLLTILLFSSSIGLLGQSGLTGTPTTLALGGTVTVPTTLDFTTSTTANLLVKKAAANYFTILNGGNVGIGTTIPAAKLEILAGADNEHLRISADDGAVTRYLSALSFDYPALSYHAWKDNALQGATSQISFLDRPGTSGYANAVRTSDILFKTAHNNNNNAYGQYMDVTMAIKATQDGGYVGIGNVNPAYKLDVNGTGRFTNTVTMNGDLIGNGRVMAGGLGFFNGDVLQVSGNATIYGNLSGISRITNNNYAAYCFMDLPLWNVNGWTFYTPNAAANSAIRRFEVGNNADIVDSKFTNSNVVVTNGNIVIGTTVAPTGYLLAVNGSAIFTKAVVKLKAIWPDYVFDKNYNLLPLAEVEKFLHKNKHLPEVPSANKIAKEGIDLGDNQTILLRKIEELTLYMIDQNKKLEQQGNEINKLRKQINSLQKIK